MMAVRYLPFALFIHDSDLHIDDLWEISNSHIVNVIIRNQQIGAGSNRTKPIDEKGIMANVKDTVIILGSYEHPHEEELIQVRDFVTSRGYDSFLIKNLPHIPEQSLEEKIRLWTMASRFCVMVDREASGHIKEYEMLKEERKPLILARPRRTGSSWTFGDDEIVDLNYIRTFEFEDSPLEILEDGMRWVEDIIEERKQAYSNHYPWRGS